MKWFLQFLILGSAVIYTLLVIIDHRIRGGTVQNNVAHEAQSNQRRLSAWGPYLPHQSLGQDRQASLTPRAYWSGERGPCIKTLQAEPQTIFRPPARARQ